MLLAGVGKYSIDEQGQRYSANVQLPIHDLYIIMAR